LETVFIMQIWMHLASRRCMNWKRIRSVSA